MWADFICCETYWLHGQKLLQEDRNGLFAHGSSYASWPVMTTSIQPRFGKVSMDPSA